jgi:hypothetical protein
MAQLLRGNHIKLSEMDCYQSLFATAMHELRHSAGCRHEGGA